MIYLPGLAVALSAFWFCLSGETDPLFLFLFAVSLLGALWLSATLEVIDRDASPYHRLPQVLIYLPWLTWQVVKSNAQVIAGVLNPSRISPGMLIVPTQCDRDLSRAMYANSITLTPGTLTVDIDAGSFVVHALETKGLTIESFRDMERRSVTAAGGRTS